MITISKRWKKDPRCGIMLLEVEVNYLKMHIVNPTATTKSFKWQFKWYAKEEIKWNNIKYSIEARKDRKKGRKREANKKNEKRKMPL